MRRLDAMPNFNDISLVLYGYVRSSHRTIFTWILSILSAGFLRLVFYWKPDWKLWCECTKADLGRATFVLLQDRYKQWYVENVLIIDSDYPANSPKLPVRVRYESISDTQQPVENVVVRRYFINKRWRYIWKDREYKFEKLLGIEHNHKCEYFQECSPLTNEEKNLRKKLYGENSISLHLTPLLQLIVKEVLSPFYIFQVFSCIVWYSDEYYYYASCIVFISLVSIIYTLREIRKNERALRNTVHQSELTQVITRYPETNTEEESETTSEELVPGDIIIVKGSTIMQCDAALLNGNVIVDESMLRRMTYLGESIPVTKVAIPYYQSSTDHSGLQNTFDIRDHSRFILFSGTKVIQTRYYEGGAVRAIVIRTAFNTAKGELVRSILYPKPVDFKFNTDTYKYVGGMALIALVGMIFSFVMRVIRKEPASQIIKRTIDIITIAVPPALPAALSAGLVYAQNRLKKLNIFCISPSTINISGSINMVVFDKTGISRFYTL
ncbi:unnamed protein product [Didymodactylos carnosus]|uniref:Cation-transporting ATPase n=1 Tax=Didymodactylos carnosus TaxID=1234261 RepID=A0A814E2H2_9BILA|nr:unnamed protein product [Didymodactylos carnosus]CAF3736536.1 unnamed protein product [Didymodactylos carnosus]